MLNADTNETLAQTHRRWVESQLKTRQERQEHFGVGWPNKAVREQKWKNGLLSQQSHQLSERSWFMEYRQATQDLLDGGDTQAGFIETVFEQCHQSRRFLADSTDLMARLALD